jgi:type II secretory pathway pseudopilin PulG
MADSKQYSVGEVTTVVVLVVSLAGTLLSGYLLVYQPQQRIDAAQATNATVVSSNVDRIDRSNERDRFRPNITYQYEFDGESYTNNNYFPGGNQGAEQFSQPVARDRADTFQPGRNVTAYVNPDNPNQSYLLERGPQQTDYLTVAVLGLFAVVSGYRGLGLFRGE